MFPGMNKHTRTLFNFCTFLLYCATILNHAFSLESCQFPAIFNFGASNSDTGGFAAAFIQPKSPNGDTFFRMPAGRLADGRLIIDFTAESLDLPFLSAYLNSLASNFSHGANFATVASTVRLPESIIPNGRSSPFYLRLQYLHFAQFKARSQTIRKGGGLYASLMPRDEYFAKALYTFDIGQNDLTQSLFLNKTATELIAAVPDIVNQFTDNIQNIYGLGARSFWVYNTRPIGCFPVILTRFPSAEKDSAGCAKPYNELADHFNVELKKALAQLRNKLPQATIVYVDIYSALYSLYTSPAEYGKPYDLGFEYSTRSFFFFNGKSFDIGQNDLTQSLFLNKTATELIAAVPDIVNQFTDNIQNIYGLGARSFWVYNTRPIGCFPVILTRFPSAEKDSAGCAKPYNELADHFNVELKKALAQLRNKLPQATIVYVDIYSALYSLYTSPAEYGFQLPLVACCGYGGNYNYSEAAPCGETLSVNGTNITVGSCKDPSVRVNWDGIHLTEAANKFVFHRVSTGGFSDPSIPLKLACNPQ